MRKYPLFISACLLFIFYSCKNGSLKIVERDTTINTSTSFNNLFFDSIQIEHFLNEHEAFKKFEQQYLDFYKQRNYEFAWFDSSGIAEQAHNFINLLNNTVAELQDSSLYNQTLDEAYQVFLNDSLHLQKKDKLLQTELLFTGQFFLYAAKIYKGSDINAAELGWFIPRKKVDLTSLLDSTLKSKLRETDQYAPLNAQYKKLQDYLIKYAAIEKQWPEDTIVHVAKPLKRGDSSFSITQIKKRLNLLGDLSATDSSKVFDTALLSAAKNFQRRTGLSIDGVVGNKMIDELNVTPKQRVRQLLINMERMRWMPEQKDSSYILVNIPEYKMHVYDSLQWSFDLNVIVGKATNSTVIFNGNLKYIVFSPYWNVPVSIVQKEILPSIKKDKNYIAKQNMEITGYSAGLPLVRQKPGPNNSLGLVKFLFPNNYDIYFHDTPNRELFNSSARSFSHGCIRISNPKKLAQFLLRSDTATVWKSNVIDSSMHLQKERWVTLKKTVPVFIVYFTAWVDKNGVLNFRKDIYGHDDKMSGKLFIDK